MATSRLRYLIHILGHLLQLIKSWPKGAARRLALLLRRVLVWWGLTKSQFRFGGDRKEPKGLPPPSTGSDLGNPPSAHSSKTDGHNGLNGTIPSNGLIPYTMTKEVESVSLTEAAFSLTPYTSARKGAGSARSLQAQRSSHNLSVISYNASRSSQVLGSDFSHPPSTKSEDYVFSVQRSPTQASARSPYGPHRQFSMSEPHIGSPTRRPIEIPADSVYVPSTPSLERRSEVASPQPIEIVRSQSPLPAFQHLGNSRITPVMPESTLRYDRRGIVPMDDYDLHIPPLKLDFTEPHAPDGWIRFIHPEGARYFYNEDKRVYTDADLFNKKIFSQVTDDIASIRRHIASSRAMMPDEYVMFIDTEWCDDCYKSTYYFVDHKTRSIFFMDNFSANADTMSGFGEVWGCKTQLHLGHEIEAQYWYFVQLYPDCIAINSGIIAELRDVVLHFIGDNMSSAYSVSPYHLEDLHKILGLTNSLEKNVGKKCVGAISLLGRFMYLFAHARFQNFHGEACARLERDVSVHGTPKNQRTWLVKMLSPVLFSAPDVHLKLLRKMYVDGIMKLPVWETSVKKMNDEWQEFILFATVLLNANVAFLAIQSIDSNTPVSNRKSAQVASYLSVIASIGSIILGLLLIRQHRTKQKDTASDVGAFLARREHKTLGLETLAILHSLPYALLMWGMVSFLVAFCLICFDESNTGTRIITSSAFVAMAILIGWCVWSAWESQPESEAPTQPDPHADDMENETGGNSKPTTISEEAGAQHEQEGNNGGRMIWGWLPGLNILKRFREGSLDSEKTVAPV